MQNNEADAEFAVGASVLAALPGCLSKLLSSFPPSSLSCTAVPV